MNAKGILCVASLLLLVCRANAQTLYDDFNGTAFDPILWRTFTTPYGNSSITETGGNAQFIHGAGLITVSRFVSASVQGRFEFAGNSSDAFTIFLRSSGGTYSGFRPAFCGIAVSFASSSRPLSPPPGGTSLCILDYGLFNQVTVLAWARPIINIGTYYDFSVQDSGNQISVFLGDSSTPILSASTSASYGQLITLANSGGLGNMNPPFEVLLDYISIAPEPSSFELLVFAGFLVIGMRSRRNTSPAATGR